MKTTIDIPEQVLEDAMRFTKARTKRDAVVTAIEAYNRQELVKEVVAGFGKLDFLTNEEIESGDMREIQARHQK